MRNEMKTLKYALVGCGRIAPNHIIAAEKNGLEIVAVCDIVESRTADMLNRLSGKHNVKTYTDYKKMLEENELDLVAIATESGNHYQIGMDAIAAGCNLIVEKPIALDITHANNLVKAAKEKGVKLCACHQNRFNKSIQKLREAKEKGAFGTLLHGTIQVRWNRNKDYYTQAPWRGTWAQDGGALMNQCIHGIDLLCWMMGDEVEEVFAYTDNLNHEFIEAEDLGMALIKFKNGSYGIIEGTTNIYPQNLEETLSIFGKTGTVKIGGKSVNKIEEWKFAGCNDDIEKIKAEYSDNPSNVYGFGHTALYGDVISAIKNNGTPYIGGEAGTRALELVLAIYKSAKTGQRVKLPLKKGSAVELAK